MNKMTEEEKQSIERLNKSSKSIEDSSKELDMELKKVNLAFDVIISNASLEDRGKAIATKNEANFLLAKLRAGGNSSEIIKQITNLSNGS